LSFSMKIKVLKITWNTYKSTQFSVLILSMISVSTYIAVVWQRNSVVILKCERLVSHKSLSRFLSFSSPFIYEKSSAIYKIVDHTSLGNILRVLRANPTMYIWKDETERKKFPKIW
jgi:hypothetical protein